MTLIDGKATAADYKRKIAEEVEQLKQKGITPHLSAILVGNDGASETYVANKEKACKEAGIHSSLIRFDTSVSEKELLQTIQCLNEDKSVRGFIVQMPLPKHISVQRVQEAIHPSKDVDGFHPINLGRMIQNLPCFVSATPKGILMLLEKYQIKTEGKHCVVLGRSSIVGSPISILMSRNTYPGNCTVTLCHSKTKNLSEVLSNADILIAALGKPGFVKAEMVKEGTVIIDVGITRVKSETAKSGFEIRGDVDFENAAPKCSYITPVPGGVGPMTIVGLLQNTLLAAKGEIDF